MFFLQRCPSQRSMKRVRQRVKQMTGSNRNGVKDVRKIIDDLNPVLRGWGNYFRTGNAAQKFTQVDEYVRASALHAEAQGSEPPAGRGPAVDPRLLPSRARSAPPARDREVPGGRVMRRPERPPVSRVREIRTHGLNGGSVCPRAGDRA